MIAFAFAGSLVARVIRGEQVSEKVNITLAFVSNYCTIKYTSFNSSLVSNFTVAYDSSIVNMNDNSGWTYYPDIAMMAAVEHANNDPTILPGIHVNIKRFTDCGPYDANAAENYYGNSGGYAGSITAQDLAEVHTDVIGVISNEYSSTTRGIAEILSEYKIPMCGTISGSTRFSNKIIYPYYWRVMNVNFSQELLLILDYWNVNDVCVVYQQDSDFSLSQYKAIKDLFARNNVNILISVGLPSNFDASAANYTTKSLLNSSCYYTIISGTSLFVSVMLASQRSLIGPSHVWLSLNYPATYADLTQKYGEEYYSLLQGLVVATNDQSVETHNLLQAYVNSNRIAQAPLAFSDFIATNGPNAYDCVQMMLRGFSKVLKKNGTWTSDMLAKRKLQNHMKFTQFQDLNYSGATWTKMLLDNHGDLILPARYYTYSGDHFNISSFAQSNDDVSNMSFYNASSSIFYDGGSVPPPDKPLALPLHDYSLNSIEGGLLLGFSSFGILISSFASLILLIGRNHKLIKSKSPIDIIVICMGCCILYGSMLLYLQKPSDFVCRARISMLLMGSMVIMAVLISKTLTKNILFGSNQKLTSLSIGKIVWGPRVLSLIFLAVQALLLAFWQRKTTLNAKITSTETFTFMICMGEKQESLTMMVLLYTFNFIVWLTLVVATLFSVRVHLETHNDTTALAFSSILLMAGLLLYQGISQYPNYFSDFVLCVIVWFITTALLCLDVLIHLQEAFVAKVLWPKQYLASKEGKSNQTKTTTSYHSLKTAAWSKALGNESMSCIYCIYFGKNSVRSKWYFGKARLFGLKGRSKLSLIFEDPKAVFSVQIHSCDDVNLIQSQVMITRKVSRQNVQVWIDFGSVQEAEIFHKELVENIWQILRNQ